MKNSDTLKTHTPGPWKAGPTKSEYGSWSVWATPLLYNIFYGSAPGINSEANARFAAPSIEMLGMLKDAALQLSRLTGEQLEHYARTFATLASEIIKRA